MRPLGACTEPLAAASKTWFLLAYAAYGGGHIALRYPAPRKPGCPSMENPFRRSEAMLRLKGTAEPLCPLPRGLNSLVADTR